MIYIDSSALLKVVIAEPETGALHDWLADCGPTPLATSTLAAVEVIRACRRRAPDAVNDAEGLLASVDMIPITAEVIDGAKKVGQPAFRSLDAIHLASALTLGEDLSSFVVYDLRLGVEAERLGLATVAPGR